MFATAPSVNLDPVDDAEDEAMFAWHRLMQLQSDLSLPVELDFYQTSGQWQGARSVLDFGTGNGHYLLSLAREFPGKRYQGIDNCAEFIEFATAARDRDPLVSGQVNFSLCDVFDVRGWFDFAIARLLVQYLPIEPLGPNGDGSETTLRAFLRHAARVIRPGGTLLVVESYDRERWFCPPVPSMEGFFESYRRHRRDEGCSRDAGQILNRLAIEEGFEISKRNIHVIPSSRAGGSEQFFEAYRCLLDVARLNFAVPARYPDVRRELTRWAESPNAYAQIGISMTCYRRMPE